MLGEPVALDVVFLIDATGSMGDEIEQLKANMVSVAEQIDKLTPRPDVRFAHDRRTATAATSS